MPDWALYRRKVPARMRCIAGPEDLPVDCQAVWASPDGCGFDVQTANGLVVNQPWGTWLALDAADKPYPIAPDQQEALYEPMAIDVGHVADGGATVPSPCCRAPLQALAVANVVHSHMGSGLSAVVACSKCNKAYGPPAHLFGDGQRAVATITPDTAAQGKKP